MLFLFYIDQHVYQLTDVLYLEFLIVKRFAQWYLDSLHRYEKHMYLNNVLDIYEMNFILL